MVCRSFMFLLVGSRGMTRVMGPGMGRWAHGGFAIVNRDAIYINICIYATRGVLIAFLLPMTTIQLCESGTETSLTLKMKVDHHEACTKATETNGIDLTQRYSTLLIGSFVWKFVF